MLKIVLAPDPVLRIVCDPLVQVDSQHQKLIKEMFKTMYEANLDPKRLKIKAKKGIILNFILSDFRK